jgi:hypothetical protein
VRVIVLQGKAIPTTPASLRYRPLLCLWVERMLMAELGPIVDGLSPLRFV